MIQNYSLWFRIILRICETNFRLEMNEPPSRAEPTCLTTTKTNSRLFTSSRLFLKPNRFEPDSVWNQRPHRDNGPLPPRKSRLDLKQINTLDWNDSSWNQLRLKQIHVEPTHFEADSISVARCCARDGLGVMVKLWANPTHSMSQSWGSRINCISRKDTETRTPKHRS